MATLTRRQGAGLAFGVVTLLGVIAYWLYPRDLRGLRSTDALIRQLSETTDARTAAALYEEISRRLRRGGMNDAEAESLYAACMKDWPRQAREGVYGAWANALLNELDAFSRLDEAQRQAFYDETVSFAFAVDLTGYGVRDRRMARAHYLFASTLPVDFFFELSLATPAGEFVVERFRMNGGFATHVQRPLTLPAQVEQAPERVTLVLRSPALPNPVQEGSRGHWAGELRFEDIPWPGDEEQPRRPRLHRPRLVQRPER